MEEQPNYIFGMHPVLEAIRSGRKFDRILLKQGLEGPQYRDLMQQIADAGIQYSWVPAEKLNRMARGGAHQGVLAFLPQIDYVDIDTLIAGSLKQSKTPMLMILDGVSDVRNLGAIARSLEVAGGQGIIVPAKGGAAINAEAVKASAGALLRIDTCRVSNLRLAAFALHQAGFRIVAASEKSGKKFYDVDLTGPIAMVMGSEGSGISKSMLSLCDETAGIPQAGEIGSLNVSVAAALFAFEAVRQRMKTEI